MTDQKDVGLATLNERIRKEVDEAVERALVPKAKLAEEGALAPITEVEVFGLPLGQAVVGGGLALVATELIDAFMPPEGALVARALVKGAATFGVVRFLSGPLGVDAARAAALFLSFSLLQDLLPIDSWLRSLVRGFVGGRAGSQSHTSSLLASGNHQSDAMAALRAAVVAEGR